MWSHRKEQPSERASLHRTGPWRLWSGAVTVVSTDLVDLDLSNVDLKLGRGRGQAMGLL